ncbi:SPASM domain-containing protein [Photobacterium sp. R1]
MHPFENKIEIVDITPSEPLLCKTPFHQVLVDPKGDLYICCGSHIQNMTPVAGNLLQQDALDIWNNDIYKTFRMSFVDGSLRYCNEKTCSAAANKDNPALRNLVHSVDEIEKDPGLFNSNFFDYLNAPENFDGALVSPPTRLYLGMDPSCNLQCPSCRNELYMEEKGSQRLDTIYGNLRSITPGIEFLEFDGAGDVFASRWYQKFLHQFPVDDFPNLQMVTLRSNGLLWTDKNWYRIHPYLRSMAIYACISVDAATAETYATVRGGCFETLMKNLKFVQRLHQIGEINEITLVMVYRKSNYQEIPAFIELGKSLGASYLVIHPLQAWSESAYVIEGSYDHEAIHLRSHPLHGEFQDFIQKHGIVSGYSESVFIDFSW